jgi:hypothetical protein
MFATSTYHSPKLATRFGRNTFVVRSDTPLADDQMHRAAPSIFAEGKHVVTQTDVQQRKMCSDPSFRGREGWCGGRLGTRPEEIPV